MSALLLAASCRTAENNFDATGTFEAQEVIISAESSGSLIHFSIEEGQTLEQGAPVGSIDSIQWYLKKKQLEAQIAAVREKKPNSKLQLASIEQQLKTALKEQIGRAHV